MTLDRDPGAVEEVHARRPRRVRPGIVRVYAGAAIALCFAGSLLRPTAASAEPAFGDSDWVAPSAGGAAGDPGAPGPRVATPDQEPIGETILRMPFRIAFLPLRLLARGTERLVELASGTIASDVGHAPQPRWKYEPIADARPDPGAGVRITRRLDSPGNARLLLTGIYSLRDRRKAGLRFRSSRDDGSKAVLFDARYSFRPNTRFYGLGNRSERGNKTIWLEEETTADLGLRFGRPIRHELQLLGGASAVGARSGYNGSAGARRLETVFTPAEVPFFMRGSRVLSYGLAGDLALIDEVRAPRKGIHLRARAEQFRSADTSDLDYRRFHVEARGYVPVFSDRRVLALRVLHNWVEPRAGSPDVPFYRLPESIGELRFNGYPKRRFVDRHLVLAQVEYRWWLSNKIFALINANAGEVASSARRLRFADKHEAYGLGLRYGYNDRMSARFDAAKGSEGLVFNLTMEDTF